MKNILNNYDDDIFEDIMPTSHARAALIFLTCATLTIIVSGGIIVGIVLLIK